MYQKYWIHGDTGIQGVSGVLNTWGYRDTGCIRSIGYMGIQGYRVYQEYWIHLSDMSCVARVCLWYEKTRQIRIGFEFLPCHVNYCRKVGTN